MKTTRHATYNLNYHLVWLPKYRNSVLVNEVADRVRTILHEIADDKGLEILDLTVQPDHVHLFVSSPPKTRTIPSRQLVQRYQLSEVQPPLRRHDGEKIGWVRGYYAGTAGHVSSETVKNYIQRHEEDES